MKIAAVVTKSRETIHADILFNFIVFSNTQNFLLFAERTWSCMVITQIGKKNYGVTALV